MILLLSIMSDTVGVSYKDCHWGKWIPVSTSLTPAPRGDTSSFSLFKTISMPLLFLKSLRYLPMLTLVC